MKEIRAKRGESSSAIREIFCYLFSTIIIFCCHLSWKEFATLTFSSCWHNQRRSSKSNKKKSCFEQENYKKWSKKETGNLQLPKYISLIQTLCDNIISSLHFTSLCFALQHSSVLLSFFSWDFTLFSFFFFLFK